MTESQSGHRIDVATASARPGMLRRTTAAALFLALPLSSGAIGATAIRATAIVFAAIGLVGIGPAVVTAAQDDIVVVPSPASSGSDLADSFPASIDGQPVEVESWSGADWVSRYDSEVPEDFAASAATDAFVDAAGASLDELEVATTSIVLESDAQVSIAAARIPGSRAYDLVAEGGGMLAADITEPSVGWDQVSGRWYASFFDLAASTRDPAVLYPAGDTVWVVRADWQQADDWRRRVEVIVAALPPQPDPVGPIVSLTQRVAVSELGIAAAFPEDWVIEILPPARSERGARRWARRLGIEGRYVLALRAQGPLGLGLSFPPACNLSLFGPTKQTPGELADLIRRDSAPIWVKDEPRDGLLRVRIYPGEDRGSSAGFTESFALGERDMVAYLTCLSKDPPGDRGLAIAESIEFLPT